MNAADTTTSTTIAIDQPPATVVEQPATLNENKPKDRLHKRLFSKFSRFTNKIGRGDAYWSPFEVTSTIQMNRCVTDFPRRDNYTLLSLVAAHALNWIVILIVGGLYAVMATAVSHPTRRFRIDDPELQYPTVPDIISNAVSTVLNVVVPLVILLVFQIFVRNIFDFYHVLMGFATAFVIQGFFKSFLWSVLGGLRPDFLTLCQPDLSRLVVGQVYYTAGEICQNIPEDFTPGFPSGHTSQAFCGWIFLALYLNAKWKPFDNRSHIWKLVLVWVGCPLLPIFVGSSRIRDFSHTPAQVLAGAIIGIITALMGYRIVYCSLFGPDNHIPTRYVWTRKQTKIEESLLPSLVGKYTKAYPDYTAAAELRSVKDSPALDPTTTTTLPTSQV